MKLLNKPAASLARVVKSQDGVIGYGIAWLLGVPVTVLVIIYLIFGR